MTTLENLEKTIDERCTANPEISWTAKLIADGSVRCAQKFCEEAIEAGLAGALGNRQDLVKEAADTLYHLLVLLKINDVKFQRVLEELEKRQGQSGIAEKRSRSNGPT